jgi:hypothetical protein
MTPTQFTIDPSALKPNPWNTNHVSPENQVKLDAAIRRMGMFKPIVVRSLDDGTYEILGGEHRRDSAVRLGINPVPVICVGKIDDARAKEISLADNARYGTDDVVGLAGLLESLNTEEHDLASFLPFTETDLHAIFASVDIDVDALDYEENSTPDDVNLPDEKPEKTPKTHTIMRFKVSLGDAERVSALIKKTQTEQGLTEADELTNAGDALVYLLMGSIKND